MFKVKKLAITGLCSLFLLAACSNSSESQQSSDTNENVELSVMIWDANQKNGVENAIDEFEKQNENISVSIELVPQDQYYTKLDASLGAEEGPDVMWQSSKAIDYIKGGALEELDSYIEKDGIDMDAYDPLVTDLYNFDGKQYGMPKDMDAWFFVYNKELFDNYGINYPSEDWTYEEMVDIAGQLKSKMAEDEYPLWYSSDLWNGIPTLIEQEGGHVINSDGVTSGIASEAGIKAFERIIDLQDKGLIPDIQRSANFNPLGALTSGKLAMSATASWNISAISEAELPEGTLNIVKFPSVNGSIVTDTNGLSYTMNKFSDHKNEAWELIKFLTSQEGAELHAEGGAGLPAHKEAQPAFIKTNSNIPGIELIQEITQHNFLRPSSQFPLSRKGLSEVNNVILPQIYSKELTVEEGVNQAKEKLESELTK